MSTETLESYIPMLAENQWPRPGTKRENWQEGKDVFNFIGEMEEQGVDQNRYNNKLHFNGQTRIFPTYPRYK
ncbi:hypothetical protein Clacol_007825 [Clathrus columnatus]|uniref:Uncharacterized protein n=1 Tax=Clathrus columnatus TaxID=1419009 RepID=A0AAV5ANS5_9AGAM|nr:hypothetical protein Clacol_007825 [Clathrus columnatus]